MKLVLVCLLVLALIENGLAFRCFQCNNANNCLPERLTHRRCEGKENACIKTTKKVAGEVIVTKDCVTVPHAKHHDDCEETVDGANKEELVCVCFSDRCNGADVNMISSIMILVSLTAVLLHIV